MPDPGHYHRHDPQRRPNDQRHDDGRRPVYCQEQEPHGQEPAGEGQDEDPSVARVEWTVLIDGLEVRECITIEQITKVLDRRLGLAKHQVYHRRHEHEGQRHDELGEHERRDDARADREEDAHRENEQELVDRRRLRHLQHTGGGLPAPELAQDPPCLADNLGVAIQVQLNRVVVPKLPRSRRRKPTMEATLLERLVGCATVAVSAADF
mmetsp:Transcript_1609/g.3440  ORF Transcript_1609/g.3440 Transcript_1609/m.3440 type:complete len:209 (+) Transcript_1609:297-923(+)